MSCEIFSHLFSEIDQITINFTTGMIQKVITLLMPVVITGLTLSFIFYGLLIIRGLVEIPITEFLSKCFRIGLITSFIFVGGFYQSHIVGLIQQLPDEVATSLLKDKSQEEKTTAILDQAASKGLKRAGEAFEMAGIFSGKGLTYAFLALLILLTTAILAAIGGAYLLLAKIALSLLAALGPFFIASLLFPATKHFFEKWLTQIINYTLLVILFASIFTLMMTIFGDYIEDIDLKNEINVGYSLGGAVILSVAMIVILQQLPALAAALAGGIALSYASELKSIGRGAASTYRGVKAGSQAIGKGVRQTYGYFKGSQRLSNTSSQNSTSGSSSTSKSPKPFQPEGSPKK